jgi:thioredoxin reductase
MPCGRVVHSVGAMESTSDWDVVIVGRSYAALSAALLLGRARRTTLVIGDGEPRNESVRHVHGVLTRDGSSPQDIVAAAMSDVEAYPTVHLVDDRVHEIERLDDGFHVRFGASHTTARLVVLATGVNDSPPGIAGLTEHWGRGVFTCPFCDGYERADRPWVLIAEEAEADHVAILRNWTDDLTVVAPGEVRRLHGDGEELAFVELVDGTKLPVAAAFVGPCFQPNNKLAVAVGAAVDERGFVTVDEMRQTTVPGLYAIGDVTGPRHNMVVAMADGVLAAAAATHALLH